jgi:hypothetical protein
VIEEANKSESIYENNVSDDSSGFSSEYEDYDINIEL